MDQIMVENTERRKNVRMEHISALKVENRQSGKKYKARMFNYSDDGLYFESDGILESGDQVYIGIQDSPYASSSGVCEYHRAKIAWRKKLKDSYFEYGYGIKFCEDKDIKRPKSTGLANKNHKNHEQKKLIKNTLKIINQNKSYDGVIKDISPSGVFFSADHIFKEGQVLTFSVPSKNDKEIKIDGRIVWADDDGFGVIFLNNA